MPAKNQLIEPPLTVDKLPRFNRDLFGTANRITGIGSGAVGGKAHGLIVIQRSLEAFSAASSYPTVSVAIPIMTVIGSDVFDSFLKLNDFDQLRYDEMSDARIAHAFQQSKFPYDVIGDLRGLVEKVHTPLAIRSSSLLEDALYQPFAGVYGTKMIPNNQADADTRFNLLLEAIKFVYASTFFKEARSYIKAAGREPTEEKMSVIIQEVVGRRFGSRYYPEISGVARSYNFYPFGHATPEEGVAILALGLGKTIVDGGLAWSFSPLYPRQSPPFASNDELLKQTQTKFWAVNMGQAPAHDPIREIEYLTEGSLADAEYDGTLPRIASTYVRESDRFVMGTGASGPRLVNFAPMLRTEDIPLADVILNLLRLSKERLNNDVEIEFAATFDSPEHLSLGFLQVRPMAVSREQVDIAESDMNADNLLLASNRVSGNGLYDHLTDVVYVKPEAFNARFTRQMAEEVESINQSLTATGKHFVLIGFGRWGSSDPWLGIPVNWSQISGARVMVEATLPDMDVELSQGSHFFHNITSFKVLSFSVPHSSMFQINWEWLNKQPALMETTYVRHVQLARPLVVKADGKSRRGTIKYD